MAKVKMPQLGETVAEGTIGKWLKSPGDDVAKNEPLLEVITDKVSIEVPSPFEGVLTAILVEEGATVPNHTELAVIRTAEESVQHSEVESAATPTIAKPGWPVAVVTDTASGSVLEEDDPAAAAIEASRAGSAAGVTAAPMTPAIRRLLREHGLTNADIPGTGHGGRITREDVTAALDARRLDKTPATVPLTGPNRISTAAYASGRTDALTPAGPMPVRDWTQPGPDSAVVFPSNADGVLVPTTHMRRGIVAQMTLALAVPHAYVQVEVDASSVVRLRDSAKHEYQVREGISLTYVAFVMKAGVEALRRNPRFNAHWTTDGLLAKRRINVGVAVALDGGLIVPVIRDADRLSIAGLSRAIADVAARARAHKLQPDDLGGGTFTIDNTGGLGSNLTLPIINVPEVAIMTMETITKRPVVVETPQGDAIAIRAMMNLVLGIDHRANDGADGAAFLRDVKTWLESVGPDTPIY